MSSEELPEPALQVFHGLRANPYMLEVTRRLLEDLIARPRITIQRFRVPAVLPSLDPEIEAQNRVYAIELFTGIKPTPYQIRRCRIHAERTELRRKSWETRFALAHELWKQGYIIKNIAAQHGISHNCFHAFIIKMRVRYGMFARRPRHGFKQPVGLP